MSAANPLLRARIFLGLTQEEMAEALGISRSTLQRREKLALRDVPRSEVALAREIVHDVVDAFVIEAWGPRVKISTEFDGDVASDAWDRMETFDGGKR